MIFELSSFQMPSRSFVGFNDACVFCFGSTTSATSFFIFFHLQGIAAGIRTSNFLRAFFSVSLISASVGSMWSILRNFKFLLFKSHFRFSSRCAASFHIFGHKKKPGCRSFLSTNLQTLYTHLEFSSNIGSRESSQ